MRRQVLAGFAGVAVAIGVLASNPLGADERLGLTGTWSGTRKQEPQGSCKRPDDGERAASLALTVGDDGKVIGKAGSGRSIEGMVHADLSVTFTIKGRAKCQGETEPHEWTAEFTGSIVKNDPGYVLKMTGVEEPCPPACSFKVEYSVKKD